MDYAGIIDRVYRQSLANRFLASISTFVGELLQGKEEAKVGLTDEEYKLLKEMLLQVYRDFVSHILCSYSLAEDAVGFVGSIAFYFQKFILAAMEEAGIPMASAEVTMIPQTYVELTDAKDIANIQKTLDMLDDDDDVQDVYHNWDE